MNKRKECFMIEYDRTKTTISRIIHAIANAEGVFKVEKLTELE